MGPMTCSACKNLKRKETKTFNGRWEVIKVELDFHYCGMGMNHRLNTDALYFRRPGFCPLAISYAVEGSAA